MNRNMLASAAPTLHDTGTILRRACSCGGTCSSCRGEKQDETLRRAPAAGARQGTLGGSSDRQGRDFSRIPAHSGRAIRVGPVDDAFEQEADRVADAVIAGEQAPSYLPAQRMIQRDIDESAGEAPAAAESDAAPAADSGEEGTDEDTADAEDTGCDEWGCPQFEAGASPAGGVARVPMPSAASGSPLPAALRAPFESRIGHDFSGVRVHTGDAAGRAAASVRAKAFTTGSDIYFAPGRFDTASRDGRHLLAHELTHVAQQARGAGAVLRRAPDPKKKAPAGKKAAPAKPKGPPCAPKNFVCDGNCAPAVDTKVVNPFCGNETCAPAPAANAAFHIRHIDVNMTSQQAVVEWGDTKKTLSVSRFTVSPNLGNTPKGSHTIGIKCGACHTNKTGHGMGWFAGFHNSLQFGFHNSQRVAKGVQSAGCVRVPGCDCAQEIHDNTASGSTSVCIHTGKGCGHELPQFGKPDTKHTSVCGSLFEALPPKPPAPKKGDKKGDKKKDDTPKKLPPPAPASPKADDDKKPEKKKAAPPAAAPKKDAPAVAPPPAKAPPAPLGRDVPVAANEPDERGDYEEPVRDEEVA